MQEYRKDCRFRAKQNFLKFSKLFMLLPFLFIVNYSRADHGLVVAHCIGNCDGCIAVTANHECRDNSVKEILITKLGDVSKGYQICLVEVMCWYCHEDYDHVDGKCNEDEFALAAPSNNGECEGEGNPCSPATGNKFQTEVDYQAVSSSGLSFTRYYNSQKTNSNQFAINWRHNYSSAMNSPSAPLKSDSFPDAKDGDQILILSNFYDTPTKACQQGWDDIKANALRSMLTEAVTVYEGGNLCGVFLKGQLVAMLTIHSTSKSQEVNIPPPQIQMLSRANGTTHYFEQMDGIWKDRFDPGVKLEEYQDGWKFTDSRDQKETYSASGQLQSIISRDGKVTTLTYDLETNLGGDGDPQTLDKVTGPFGRTLSLNYNEDGKLMQVSTPDGIVTYEYDSNGNLAAVHYPGGSYRQYHYEDTRFTHHLTGITDENRDRFAIWAYDDQGRAILSEHADGVERVEFIYNDNGSTTIKDALGAKRTYQFQAINGSLKIKQVTGDQCVTCWNGHMKTRNYDSNGFLSGFTDWRGNITRFETDARGLQTCRIEGYGTPDVLMVRTAWHANYRVPIRIDFHAPESASQGYSPEDCLKAESNWKRLKTTHYRYDEQGRLLSRTTEAP